MSDVTETCRGPGGQPGRVRGKRSGSGRTLCRRRRLEPGRTRPRREEHSRCPAGASPARVPARGRLRTQAAAHLRLTPGAERGRAGLLGLCTQEAQALFAGLGGQCSLGCRAAPVWAEVMNISVPSSSQWREGLVAGFSPLSQARRSCCSRGRVTGKSQACPPPLLPSILTLCLFRMNSPGLDVCREKRRQDWLELIT